MKLFLSLIVAAMPLLASASVSPAGYVDTRQGTDSDKTLSYGCTYPCTAMPQGTHAWSPRTRRLSEKEKYVWNDSAITGFDLTHLFNMWMTDWDMLSLMPEVGEVAWADSLRAAGFSHDREVAMPHYYKVTLDNGIRTEIAPTQHCAFLRFTYPSGKGAPRLVFDGSAEQSHFERSGRRVTGWVHNMFWATPAKGTMKCWFVFEFDRDIRSFDTLDGRACATFAGSGAIGVRVGCSFVSAEAAAEALKELPSTLEKTKALGEAEWNSRLSAAEVSGGTEEQMKTFYTCLYRANCFPRDLTEGGRYFSPFDASVHEGEMYCDIVLWDAYNSLMPMRNLLYPEEQGRYVAAMAQAAAQSGWLPESCSPGETGMMTGNHAISVFADAWTKGIRTFDAATVLKAYLHDITTKGPVLDAAGRAEWEDWFTLGYVAEREGRGCAASKTLEYAYDDFCAWKLAKESGNDAMAAVFERQMGNWRNVFDRGSGLVRGRLPDGNWSTPFDPCAWDGYFPFESRAYCEGNAWQWTWSVKHDIRGLMTMMGSRERFVEKLDSTFSLQTPLYGRWAELKDNKMMDTGRLPLGQYVHGNEPVHHLAYLYDYAGQPWKTQRIVRAILDSLYSSGPRGYAGDEDQGAMSSWYVLSAIGIYPVTPGVGQYALGSPLFGRTVLKVPGGEFVVEAEGNSPENVYIQSAELNGVPLDRNFLLHSEIVSGGVLHLVMGPEPSLTRGTSQSSSPWSLSDEGLCARFSPLAVKSAGPAYDPSHQYRNPILPGFYPDPSICRVGDDFYMVNSTFQYFPSIPVWHSRDLIHWKQCGSVLDSDSKIRYERHMMLYGTFAPQISYNPFDRKFYVVCTQVGGGLGNFFCTCDDPLSGCWSDPVRLPDVSGIDPSLFFDEDGKAYLVSSTSPEAAGGHAKYVGDGAIVMWEFDWKSGRTVGEPHIAAQSGIVPEDEPKSFEGPHIYKVDGKYFLMCAEGGTELNHSEVILSSADIGGTFRPCAINPILTQRDLDPSRPDPVTCTGHADLVCTASGAWYAVFLGCQPYEGQETFNTGRETFLLPVHWKDGQPVILEKGEAVKTVVEMDNGLKELSSRAESDWFDGLDPGPLWTADGLSDFALSARGSLDGRMSFDSNGTLALECSGVPLGCLGRPSAVFERMASTRFVAETVMDFSPAAESEAGLILWHDDDHYMTLCKTLDSTGRPVLRLQEVGAERRHQLYCLLIERMKSSVLYQCDIPLDSDVPVALKAEAVDPVSYEFSYAFVEDGRPLEYRRIGKTLDGSSLSTMNCAGFQGAMIGVYAY